MTFKTFVVQSRQFRNLNKRLTKKAAKFGSCENPSSLFEFMIQNKKKERKNFNLPECIPLLNSKNNNKKQVIDQYT